MVMTTGWLVRSMSDAQTELRNIICTETHRAEVNEWDGGEGQCPRCCAVADAVLPEVARFVADWIGDMGMEDNAAGSMAKSWLLAMGLEPDSPRDEASLDEQVIEAGDVPERGTWKMPLWMKRYAPLFAVLEGHTAEELYNLDPATIRARGPRTGIAVIALETQILLISRLHQYGYLREPIDLLRGA